MLLTCLLLVEAATGLGWPLSSRGLFPVHVCLSISGGPYFLYIDRPNQHHLIITNLICQDCISKEGHVLRFPVDVNLGKTLLTQDSASGAEGTDQGHRANTSRACPQPNQAPQAHAQPGLLASSPPPRSWQAGPSVISRSDHHSGTFQTLLLCSRGLSPKGPCQSAALCTDPGVANA